MDNRERVIRIIAFQPVDYIPHSVNFNNQIYQDMVAYTGKKNYIDTIDNHITQVSLSKPQIEVKPGYFQDEYGVVWNKAGVDKDVGVVDNLLIDSPESFDSYKFPTVDYEYVKKQMERLVSCNDHNFHMAELSFSLFERAWTLCGMENLLCYMIIEPEFVHQLMHKLCARNLEIIDIALQYDFDCFYFGDDWGQQKGLIMGPKHWREFIKPYVARMYQRVKSNGRYVAHHCCGDIREIIDDVVEIGLDIYQTFQPEIYGLDYAKNLQNRLTIWGGISTQMDLPYKTPEEIREITKRTLAAFPKGGLIAAPTHGIPDDVPPENVEAMINVLLHQNQYV